MRPLCCLVFGALSLAACSSSSSSSPPSKDLYLPLHLTSVQDTDGNEYATQFQDLPASHLYVKIIFGTRSDGTSVATPTVVDPSDHDLAASLDDSHTIIRLGTSPLVEGRLTRIDQLPFNDSLTGITSLTSTVGDVANLTVGSVLDATAQVHTDDGGGEAVRDVTVKYTVEARSPVTFAVSGPSFNGPTYLPLLPTRVGGSQPIAYSDSVTMSIDGGAPFPFDDNVNGDGAVSGGAAWLYGLNGQLSGDTYDDGPRRTVFFPAGTAWDGSAVAAAQLDVAPAPLSAQTAIDFSVPADAAPPYVVLRGNAKVTADPLCEKGTCLVIEETADAPSTLCTDSAVGSVAGFWVKSQKGIVIRTRILGHDVKDGERIYLGRPGFLFEFGDLAPTSTVPGFTYDSGWMSAPSHPPFANAVAAYVINCAPGVRVMFQTVMPSTL